MISTIHFSNKTLIMADEKMERCLELASKVAKSQVPVLLCGESGTGKELIARFIHEKSSVKQGPFVSVNCAAIPEGLLEAELFGYERGSFTGAIAQRIGKFERASRGTLLLDEISEMPLPLQAKLLRVLQEGEIDRIGGGKPISINTRIIATTNRDPYQLISEKKFRKDLFYRLNVFQLECAPLRGRRDAIVNLAMAFLGKFSDTHERGEITLTEAAKDRLANYPWPGNIRELQNVMERSVLLCAGSIIDDRGIEGLQAEDKVRDSGEVVSLFDLEKVHILETLKRTSGNRKNAAELLGISVRTLRNKLKLYDSVSSS